MNFTRRVGLVVAIAAACGYFATDAQAQFGGSPYVLGYGFSGGGLYGGTADHPPYFAMFPPVYYSFPVARPYGYSPFAYPPGFMTPDVERVKAKEVVNPFVPRKTAAPAPDRTAATPRVMINPFVHQRRPTALAARPLPGAAE